MYVWKMFGCLLYIYNTKKACFVRLRGCPYALHTFGCPHIFGCPCMFGHPPYVWTSLTPLDVPIHLVASKHTGGPNMWGSSNHIEGCPNIGGTQTYGGVQSWRCPNIQVGIQTYGGVQTYEASKHTGGVQTYGGHQSRQGHPNIIQTYGGI